MSSNLTWDSPVQAGEEKEKIILDNGVYIAICTGFEKGYNEKHDCPMAAMTWSIPYKNRYIEVKDWALLKESWAWKIHQIFRSTGMAKPEDETIIPRWDALLWSCAQVQIVQGDFQGKDGVIIVNRLKSYLPREDTPSDTLKEMAKHQRALKQKAEKPAPDDEELPF